MLTKDITRFLHRPRKHYSGVRLQQGRLLLDSDFNESARLRAEDRRNAVLTLVGGKASPDQGFSIGAPFDSPGDLENVPEQVEFLQVGSLAPTASIVLAGVPTVVRPVSIRKGSFYIGGERVALERPEHIAFQRDYLQARPENLEEIDPDIESPESPLTNFRSFFYLHSWDQSITAVEDEELFEAALGGEDTSTRVRRMRRVEVMRGLSPRLGSCRRAFRRLLADLTADHAVFDARTGELRSRGRLQLVFREESERQRCGRCRSDPGAAFLGFDNQALRILLTSATTFVWSLSSGASLYRVCVRNLDNPDAGVEVEMLTPPADEAHWPLTNRVVEILPFGALIQGGGVDPNAQHPHFRKAAAELGAFTRVLQPYDPNTRTFRIDPGVGLEALQQLVFQWDEDHPNSVELGHSTENARYFYARFWHDAPDPTDVELPVRLNERLPELGETDVFPVFRSFGRRGDYWIAALRPGAPEPIVPFDLSHKRQGVPPHGPRHFYAPLALVEGGELESPGEDRVRVHSDCRPQIQKLSDRGCVTFTVGDGVSSFGDYHSIQEAIEALPEGGGRVSVRPGVYRERLFINDRQGLVLEGCGDASVLEMPVDALPPPTFAPLIEIGSNSQHIVITGFSLRSIERHAIIVRQGSRNITLTGLSVIAGVRRRGRFVPGTANSATALIELLESHSITLSKVILEPVSRPALLIRRVDFARISELTAVGSARSRFTPRRPMIQVLESPSLSIRDSMISSFGQVGLSLGSFVQTDSCLDADLRGLSVVSGQHRSTRNGAITASKSGIRIERGERVTLEDSSIVMEASLSEHAGVVVFGKDIVLRGNRIEALMRCFDRPRPATLDRCRDLRALAWSGLQIRGGSERIEVRANHVLGGVGHGITLGSLVWTFTPPGGGTPVLRSEGAGRGQLLSRADGTRVVRGLIRGSFREGRRRFLAVDEGPLQRILIADNRIEQMFTNGISVLSVLGMPGDDLIDLESCCIERNTIINNLLQPAENVPNRGDVLPFDPARQGEGSLIPVLPFGGIVLGTVTNGIEIRGNLVANNGTSGVLPYNGIFILNGDGISIGENRITGNGGRASSKVQPRPGVRAGIAVMLAGTGSGVDTEAALGSFIRNETLSSNDGSSLRVFNNSVLHPEGRALHVVATGPVAIDGNSFASLGHHGSNLVSDLFAVGEAIFLMNMGPPWEDESPGNFGSPYSPAPGTEKYLLNSPSPESPSEDPRLMIGDGGGVLFNNNQVTYDWELRRVPPFRLRAPISYFPVALLSLDHVGIEANQFAFRLRGLNQTSAFRQPVKGYAAPVFSHVFAVGGTLQVGGNRFAETVTKSVLSLLALAELMQVSSFNQSTHSIFVATTSAFSSPSDPPPIPETPSDVVVSSFGQSPFAEVGDQVMFAFDNINDNSSSRSDRLRGLSLRFLELLLDRK